MKVPEVTINEWLQAEEALRASRFIPQPKGYITTNEYASLKGCSVSTAKKILLDLWRANITERVKWNNGFVYKLKK